MKKVILCLTLLVAFGTPLKAGESKPAKTKPVYGDRKVDMKWFDQGMTSIKKKNYKEALKFFKKADKEKPNDPDILNMVAFTQRNLGKINKSFNTYERALKLRPRFPQAREYLGQAHLQAALQQVEYLRGYGAEGADDLKKLIKAIKKAAAGL